jgi:hypothetical protein
MSNIDEDYKLIPMSDIDDEAREIAVRWVENYQPMGFDLPNKHKLASDIMNYARRHSKKLQQAGISGKRLVQLLDKELETKGIPHYEDENTQGYCAGLLKAIELIQAACANGAVDTKPAREICIRGGEKLFDGGCSRCSLLWGKACAELL